MWRRERGIRTPDPSGDESCFPRRRTGPRSIKVVSKGGSFSRGTDGSNPVPSSAESGKNRRRRARAAERPPGLATGQWRHAGAMQPRRGDERQCGAHVGERRRRPRRDLVARSRPRRVLRRGRRRVLPVRSTARACRDGRRPLQRQTIKHPPMTQSSQIRLWEYYQGTDPTVPSWARLDRSHRPAAPTRSRALVGVPCGRTSEPLVLLFAT